MSNAELFNALRGPAERIRASKIPSILVTAQDAEALDAVLEFVAKVKKMRDFQKLYFRTRARRVLSYLTDAEKVVDDMLEDKD